jgi:hypothetical protein
MYQFSPAPRASLNPSLLLSLALLPLGGAGVPIGKPGEPTGDTEPGERLYGDALWWRWGWKCGPGDRAMVVVALGPDGDVLACWT